MTFGCRRRFCNSVSRSNYLFAECGSPEMKQFQFLWPFKLIGNLPGFPRRLALTWSRLRPQRQFQLWSESNFCNIFRQIFEYTNICQLSHAHFLDKSRSDFFSTRRERPQIWNNLFGLTCEKMSIQSFFTRPVVIYVFFYLSDISLLHLYKSYTWIIRTVCFPKILNTLFSKPETC